jgi:5'-deoxynucleotidase YfbR-like HD superfamily hydrolase
MDNVYLGGRVVRNHALLTQRQTNVADHSWGVAKHLYFMYPSVSRYAILTALFHDVGEITSGDFIWPMKAKYAELKNIDDSEGTAFCYEHIPEYENIEENTTHMELILINIADMLEFYDCCVVEESLGNTCLVDRKQVALDHMGKLLQNLLISYPKIHPQVEEYVQRQAAYKIRY